MNRLAAAADVPSNPVDTDAAATSHLTVSGREDVTSQRRHGPREVVDRVTGLLVRQCRSWTTKLSAAEDADTPPTSATLSSASPATVSRPPRSPRSSLTGSARPVDPRSFLLKSDSATEPASTCFFASSSTEDVVVVDAAVVAATAGSDTSSGRGSASPDTRSSSSRGKSRFKKMLRPLRRTWSAGCGDDFRKFHDSAHKPAAVQQVCFLSHYRSSVSDEKRHKFVFFC